MMRTPSRDDSRGLSDRVVATQHLAARLADLMKARGWNQAEVRRRSGLSRDKISAYCGGRAFPTPRNLEALARAFEVQPGDLVPSGVTLAPTMPRVLDISHRSNNKAWVRMDRLVSAETAAKIQSLVLDDDASDPSK